MPNPWLAERRPYDWPAARPRIKRHAERVVEAMASNFAEFAPDELRRYTRLRDDPSKWPDALLIPLGHTRKEAVEFARALRRVLAPAYAAIATSADARSAAPLLIAPRRTGTRVRGAGRPAARRTRTAASSSAGSGDDGSGPADPEPPSARRIASGLGATSSYGDCSTGRAER